MRHRALRRYDPKTGVSISTLAYEYPAGHSVPEHAHGSDQLIHATRGVMEISAGQSLWLTPPHLAVWIPAGTQHRIRMPSAVSMRTLYLRRGLLPHAPESCTVLHISALFRELVVEAVRIGQLRTTNHLHCALRDLILFQLRNASPVPTFVRLPEDSRALRVAEGFIANQADAPSLDALCRKIGVSVRTIGSRAPSSNFSGRLLELHREHGLPRSKLKTSQRCRNSGRCSVLPVMPSFG
jgi:hypothetical protein